MSGRVLAGRYLLTEVLGQGGMGVVWRSHDPEIGRDVAIKELRLPGWLDADEVARRSARMQREVRAAGRVRHPNVVTVFDIVVEDGRPWIVMQLLPGRPLTALIAEGAMAPERVARIGARMLAGLAAVHRVCIEHRDVKPANVIVDEDDGVVLTDFGIATHPDAPAVTETGATAGTPEYMAPERASGRPSGAPADLWSLGVTLYEMVEGFSPFRRDNPLATLQAVALGRCPPPTHAGPLAEAVLGLLTPDPAARMTAADAAPLLAAASAGGAGERRGPGTPIARPHLASPDAPGHPDPAPSATSLPGIEPAPTPDPPGPRTPPEPAAPLAPATPAGPPAQPTPPGPPVALASPTPPGPPGAFGSPEPPEPATPPGSPTPAALPSGSGRPAFVWASRRVPVVVGAVVGVVLAVAGVVVGVLVERADRRGAASATASGPPGVDVRASGAVVVPSGGPGPADPAGGFRRVTARGAFTVLVPAGWTVRDAAGERVYYRSTDDLYRLGVRPDASDAHGDPCGELAVQASKGLGPGSFIGNGTDYHLIRLLCTSVHGQVAGLWEFTWNDRGTVRRSINMRFVEDGRTWDFWVSGPDGGAALVRSAFDAARESFTPGG
ncbi:serine/threonine-protein kinase [Embleya sp. NPDC059237]|uniref:serine/threonine-protein kinase n=1 Tax=Embleya sp. NPDC059237 TaxID=3346784 RepID=UPI0036A61963